jgi:hypothetical protein
MHAAHPKASAVTDRNFLKDFLALFSSRAIRPLLLRPVKDFLALLSSRDTPAVAPSDWRRCAADQS